MVYKHNPTALHPGDLVRTVDGRHGMVHSVDWRNNTAVVQHGADSPFSESVSWWNLRGPTDATAMHVAGVPLDQYSQPVRTRTRIVAMAARKVG